MTRCKHCGTTDNLYSQKCGRYFPRVVTYRQCCSCRHKELSIKSRHHQTEETKKKISTTMKGYKKGEEHRANLSRSLKGRTVWIEGKKHSQITRSKISLAHGGTGIPYENFSYPQSFFDLRPTILQRDGNVCVACKGRGKSKRLVIHHVDGDMKNSDQENLVTLCHGCHVRHHRWGWNPRITTTFGELVL